MRLNTTVLGPNGGRGFPNHCGESQVHPQHLHDRVVQDLWVVTGGETFPGPRVGESQGGLIPVNLEHLGVVVEDHPRDTSAILDSFEDLRPLATQRRDVYGSLNATALFSGGLLGLSR